MKKSLFILLLIISTTAIAQETNTSTPQQKIEAIIGKLVVENASLLSTVDNLNKQIVDLKKQLEIKKESK